MKAIPNEQTRLYQTGTTGTDHGALNEPTRQPETNVTNTTPTHRMTNEEKKRLSDRGRAGLMRKFDNNPPAAALFGKVLDHIEADEDLRKKSRKLFNAIHNGGLGHVLWGSKPSQLLTKDQADLLNWLQQGYNLKDNFLLLQDKTTEDDTWKGVLVNKYNLGKVLEQNADVCASSSFTQGKTDVKEITDLLAQQNLTDELLTENQHLLGTMLGYGPGNAGNFAKLYDDATPESVRAELSARTGVPPSRRFADEIWASSLAAAPQERFIATTTFKAWDTEETNEVVNRYLNESIDIREIFLKEAADSDNYARNAVRTFLEGVYDTEKPKK